MIDNLYLNNYDIKSYSYLNQGSDILTTSGLPHFVLKTCQRLLVVSYGAQPATFVTSQSKSSQKPLILNGADAYQYILEVLCGLQSQLLGENEIVAQFKTSLQLYNSGIHKNKNLTIILEKLLQDAKDIRTKYLSHIGQSTYASISKKLIGKSHDHVLIIGTGHLALDLLQSLKKTYKIYMCARNQSKLEQWQRTANFETLAWLDLKTIENYPIILNTVGVPNYKLFGPEFFYNWRSKHSHQQDYCFIDFGSPSSVILPKERENLYTLQDLFSHGNQFDLDKLTKIEHAKRGIEQIVLKRVLWLDQKMNRDQNFQYASI
jgi:glutamyl-tRNA reductase